MPIDEGYARITWTFTGEAAPTGAAVTLGVNQDPGVTITQAVQAAENAWEDNLLAQQVSTITLDKIMVKYGPDQTGLASEQSSGSVGVLAGTAVPPNGALLVTKVTEQGGRRGNGRMFIPGLLEGNVGPNGNLTAAYVNAWAAALLGFHADLVAAGLPPVILRGNPGVSPVIGPIAIQSFQPQATMATQRRRLRR